MRIEWHSNDIAGAGLAAWEDSMRWLQRQFIQEFTENKWAWPTGQSPRDIIDTATLRNSTMTAKQARVSDTVSLWSWNPEYALAVHNGATFISGPFAGRTFPARPWTKKPLEGLQQFFVGAAKRRLRQLP